MIHWLFYVDVLASWFLQFWLTRHCIFGTSLICANSSLLSYSIKFVIKLCLEFQAMHLGFLFFTSLDFFWFEGCGFVKLSNRDMAVAAINALNGNYVMRVKHFTCFNVLLLGVLFLPLINFFFTLIKGCDQPLIVRFADPKKPRIGESRFFFLKIPLSLHFLCQQWIYCVLWMDYKYSATWWVFTEGAGTQHLVDPILEILRCTIS